MFSKSQTLYIVLCGLFITALVIADIIGAKLIVVGPFDIGAWHIEPLIMSAGIIPFPLTFVLTDLINEFYGKKGAKFITFLGLGMAIFAALLLYVARIIPTSDNSLIPDPMFQTVFGLSGRMFFASLCAYTIGQLLDITVFHTLRRITREKMLWLRATGSTVVSQFIDSIAVAFIALSGSLATAEVMTIAVNNYGVKFVVAILLTPLCYLGHAILYRALEKHELQAFHETSADETQADTALTIGS